MVRWTLVSLSARRAWIEMQIMSNHLRLMVVALRKESVDRNMGVPSRKSNGKLSLSARRAWIEMLRRDSAPTSAPVALRKESVDRNRRHEDGTLRLDVALRKESVDRNAESQAGYPGKECRSPQGERG